MDSGPRDFRGLLAVAFRHDAESAEARAEIRRLLDATSVSALPALDERLRSYDRWHTPGVLSGWFDLPPAAVRDLPFELAALASCHRSGYVRESAVDRLAELGVVDGLPFLLIRVNDWLAPVRHRASALAETWIRDEHARLWVECLPILERLRLQRRADHGPLRERVASFLVSGDRIHHLHAAFESADQSTRRRSFELCLTATPGLDRRTLELGVRSKDPMLRLAAVKSLPGPFDAAAAAELETLGGGERSAAAELTDAAVSSRRSAVPAWLKTGPVRPDRALEG